jgi:hypothetical protein
MPAAGPKHPQPKKRVFSSTEELLSRSIVNCVFAYVYDTLPIKPITKAFPNSKKTYPLKGVHPAIYHLMKFNKIDRDYASIKTYMHRSLEKTYVGPILQNFHETYFEPQTCGPSPSPPLSFRKFQKSSPNPQPEPQIHQIDPSISPKKTLIYRTRKSRKTMLGDILALSQRINNFGLKLSSKKICIIK